MDLDRSRCDNCLADYQCQTANRNRRLEAKDMRALIMSLLLRLIPTPPS